MFAPAEHPGLEEGAVDDQLTTTVEEVEQACLPLRPVELVRLLDGQPPHPPTLRSQRVTSAGQRLLLHEELLARSLPRLHRHDRGGVLRKTRGPRLPVSLLVLVHLFLLVLRSDTSMRPAEWWS